MYSYPFIPQMPQPQAQPQQYFANGVRWVNGIDEVRSVYVPLGECAMFMDQNDPLFYVKRTDMYGISTIDTARFELVQNTPQTPQQATGDSMDERMKELEAKYESLVQRLESAQQPGQPVLVQPSPQADQVAEAGADGLPSQVIS